MNIDNIWYQGDENHQTELSNDSPRSKNTINDVDNDKQIEKQRKKLTAGVYDCLASRSLGTFGFVYFAWICVDWAEFLHKHSVLFLAISLVLTATPYITLMFYKDKARRNLDYDGILALFTIGISLFLSISQTYISPMIIFQASLMTTISFLLLAECARETNDYYSNYRDFLFPYLSSALIGGLINIFLASSFLDFLLAISGVGIFTLYIVYDVERLVQKSTEFDEIEEVLITLNLHTNFINLLPNFLKFIFLSLTRRKNDKEKVIN